MVWLWIIWAATLVAVLIVAWAIRPRTSTTDSTGSGAAQQAIATVTDFRCAVAPGALSTAPQLRASGPGTLIATWGAATLERRGVNYTVTLTGAGDPVTTTTSGLSTVFSGLPPGSVWSVTVTPVSSCGTGPPATSGNGTVCNGPPANIAPLINQPATGVVAWAATAGADDYSLTFTQTDGVIVKAVAGVRCTGVLCSYDYTTAASTPLTVTISGVGPCGFSQ